MKKHEQLCGLALALDLLGDRWTLLIVRELMTGSRRFSDLRRVLSGLAPNLLTSRLKSMETSGLITHLDKTKVGGSCYVLTEIGKSLTESVYALIRWGGQFFPSQGTRQSYHPHWLLVAIPAVLEKKIPSRDFSLSCLVEVDSFVMAVEVVGGRVFVRSGVIERPDLKIRISYPKCLALFSGRVAIERVPLESREWIEGSREARKKFRTFVHES